MLSSAGNADRHPQRAENPHGATPAAGRKKASIPRHAVEILVLSAVAGLLLSTWVVQGVVIPFPVASNSMAPAVTGPVWRAACPDCGWTFVSDRTARGLDGRLVCPNCDGRRNTVDDGSPSPGDRLVLNRAAWLWTAPRRWEVVAFRDPQANRWALKRLAGLPGEEVQIRHGDLYINGQLASKTLQQLQAMAIPVHQPPLAATAAAGIPSRWRPEPPDGGWSVDQGTFRHRSAASGPSPAWCEYHHQRWSGEGTRRPAAIDDDWAFNAATPRREEEIAAVGDLLLEFDLVAADGEGELWVRLQRGGLPVDVQWVPHRGTCRPSAKGVAATALSVPELRTPGVRRLAVALCDGRLLAGVDGRTCLSVALPDAGEVEAGSVSPVALGASGLNIEIRGVRLSRDVYYTSPTGYRARWGLSRPHRLGADEYFVLGDNSPVSDDSRSWPDGPAVVGRSLLGRAWLAVSPPDDDHCGGRQFRLPGLGLIRYIR